jgi:carboxyl-terminal processing protease
MAVQVPGPGWQLLCSSITVPSVPIVRTPSMRRIDLIVVALLMSLSAAPAAGCERLVEFDRFTTVVAQDFYDRSFRGLDWPARVASYRREVDCGGSEQSLSRLVNRLLAELNASHTAVFTATDLEYWAYQSIFSRRLDTYPVTFAGIWPLRRANGWFAKYVLPGSPAYVAGVLPGDQLLSLNEKPFDPLGMPPELGSTLVLSSDGSRQRSVAITPRRQSLQQFLLDATASSESLRTVHGKRVGYLHLWAGTHPQFLRYMNATLKTFVQQGIDVLVLDLRGGFGGAGVEYLALLKGDPQLQRIPKYFITDDGARSGKELLAVTIRQQRLGTLVGSTTAGAFLAGRAYSLFNDRYFLYVAVFDPGNDPPIEGVGVVPDVVVPPCREFCAGVDPQLQKVFDLIAPAH